MELGQVQLSAVAFVLVKAIFWKMRAKVTHHSIPRHLGDDTRCRNAQTVAIAVYDRCLRKWKWQNRQPIDEDVIGSGNEHCDGRLHRLMGSPQNVDRVYLDRINYSNRPTNLGVARKIHVNFFAQFRGELLGIIQFPVSKFLRKNDCCRYHRPGERAATGFVNSGDTRNAGRTQFLFVSKSAAPIHFNLTS